MTTGKLIRRTGLRTAKNGHMHLDLTKGHFSLITNINQYCKNWKFVTSNKAHFTRHCKVCVGPFEPRPNYSKVGRFRCKETLFDRLVKCGIQVEQSEWFCHSFSSFDLESCRVPLADDDPKTTKGLKFLNRQEVFAATVNSTVEGYNTSICIRTETSDPQGVVKQLVEYFLEISRHASHYERQRLQNIFDQLEANILMHYEEAETDDEELAEFHQWMIKDLEKLMKQLEDRCNTHCIYSFNGSRFDNKLIGKYMVCELLDRGIELTHVIH